MIEDRAVVRFGTDSTLGVLRRKDKREWVDWPDGGSDTVYRDVRGWPWDEYGSDDFTDRHGGWRQGTRLHIVSRSRRDVRAAVATLAAAS